MEEKDNYGGEKVTGHLEHGLSMNIREKSYILLQQHLIIYKEEI